MQVELLKAFAVPAVEEVDLLEIRKLLSQYFARKASAQVHYTVVERGFTVDEVESIAHQYNYVAHSPQPHPDTR